MSDQLKVDPNQQPVINVHTHIFTEKNIPPLIAKTFVPWPFYHLLHIGLVFRLVKVYRWLQDQVFKPFLQFQTRIIATIKTNLLSRYIDYIVSAIITFNAFMIVIIWSGLDQIWDWCARLVGFTQGGWLRYILLYEQGFWVQLLVILALAFFYPKATRLLWSLAVKLGTPLRYIPSQKSLEFLERYLTIAEFAKYKSQKRIFDRLIKMYEPGAGMVVLPMDMSYMKAGKPTQNYLDQLAEIQDIKDRRRTHWDRLIPFVFVDPRRIAHQVGPKLFFDWELTPDSNGGHQVLLKDCYLRDYLEGPQSTGSLEGYFKGIKIYPALGYYPFDELLLPLWSYCQQRQLPITTHCIMGTIFYRGPLQKYWMQHPVFKDSDGRALDTQVASNYQLQANFTHPLNYLVLLEEHYLAQVVGASRDKRIHQLFGYDSEQGTISKNLQRLKINLAHYGGKEEWLKFLEADRQDIAVEMLENPSTGAQLCRVQNPQGDQPQPLYSKPAWIWQHQFDWYTIISSMMLQYPNVYADISYILHNSEIKPLLNQMLRQNTSLAKKILFGTDFFVVRNHKSEKELLADLNLALGQQQMDQITRHNPRVFLSNITQSIT